jgi:hypothetical protein
VKCFKISLLLMSIFLQVNCNYVDKMKQDANTAKKQTDSILKEFKKIDEGLEKSNKAIDSSGKMLKEAMEQKIK